MIVNQENISQFELKDGQNFDDFVVEITNDLDCQNVIGILRKIVDFESKHSDVNVKLKMKGLDTKTLIDVFKFIFNNTGEIRNVSLINNVFLLIKTYNTFSEDFFLSDDVFINDIEQFLDVKLDLQKDIEILIHDVIEVFLSICKSSNKLEYSVLDQYFDIPHFYGILLGGMDIITLFGLISTLDGKVEFTFKNYKNAFQLVDNMLGQYAIANSMMNKFLSRINNDNKCN